MAHKHVEIVVKGTHHSGKTLVSYLIEKALSEYGIEVAVIDQDGPKMYRMTKNQLAETLIHDRGDLDRVFEEMGVTIQQENIIRSK